MSCANELTVEGGLPDLATMIDPQPELVSLPAPTEVYQSIDSKLCQCRAATNMTAANMVELERYWAKVVIECDTKNVRENLCLDRDLLALRATGLRNEAAGAALKTFYQLAGLEAQKQYLQLGIAELQLMLSRIDQLREEGIELPGSIDRSSVVRKLAEFEEKKLQLDFSRIQLNGQLQKLTGCPLDEFTFYWPQLDWQPDLTPLDVATELAVGLDTRSDLRGLSLVLCQLEKNTLPVARGVLQIAESTVGTVEPQEGALHIIRCFRCNETELPVRCRQLSLFYKDAKQNATAEIKSASYQIGLQQQRVVAAQKLVQEMEERLHELEETRDVKDVSVFEISNARAQVFNAQSKLIESVVQLFIANVSLRQAQGMLAVECGFSPTLCTEGCCDGACVRCQGSCKETCNRATCCKANCSCAKCSESCCE